MEKKMFMYVVVNMFDYQYQDKRSYYGAPYLARKDAQKYIIDTTMKYSNIALVLFKYEVLPVGSVTLVKQLDVERANVKALKMTNAQMEKAKKTAEETMRNTLVAIS